MNENRRLELPGRRLLDGILCMLKDQAKPVGGLDIARKRIEAERTARTGWLDIGNLGLTRLPTELGQLDHLETLVLGGVFQNGRQVFRVSGDGSRALTDEPYQPNRLDNLAASLTHVSGLRHLDCSGAALSDLGPLSGLDALQRLDLQGTQVRELGPLNRLSALQQLNLRDTPVSDLSPLAGLTALQHLDLQGTQGKDLGPLVGLAALQTLELAGTQVSDLSPLAGLMALQRLDLQGTPVGDLAPLAGLGALVQLNLRFTHVSDLSPLAGLTALQHLDLRRTQVKDLGPLVGLAALQSLKLAGTQVSDLSPLVGLAALQTLELAGTQVSDLSPLAGLTVLRHLELSGTQIRDLSPLTRLSALQHLNLSGTQVTDFSGLAALSALQSLGLAKTDIEDLGPLAELKGLRALGLAETRAVDLGPLVGLNELVLLELWQTSSVSSLPETVVGLPQLRELLIGPQPGLSDIPAEVLSQRFADNCLPRLRAHLADIASGGSTPLRDVKVIVLGNGRVGKTQLCRRLRSEAFEPDADSTHGISVTSIELSLPDEEEPVILNLWDFGGQDIYHGTHALFMRTRAIFVLVWTPESEHGEHAHGDMVFRNQPLPYWLEYIRHLGGAKSPVLLVQTRCDGGLGECPNLPVDGDFLHPLLCDGRLFKRVAYSAKDNSGRAGLMEAVQTAVTQLRAVQGQPLIGRGWLAVWQQLRGWRDADAEEDDPGARRRRLLAYVDFVELCAQHGVTSPETFAEVLHNSGIVFYRSNLFGGQLVLDQSWMLDAIYAVFTRNGTVYDTLRRLHGRFTRPLLDALLWRGRGLTAHDQQSLIDMMQASGICFVHRRSGDPDETEYVAPDLLPEGRAALPPALAEELAARWEPIVRPELTAAILYRFLSPSIGRAMLSEFGQLASSCALYWRYGLCLYDSEHRAAAMLEAITDADETEDPPRTPGYGGRLLLRVKGEGSEQLLSALLKRIEKFNQEHGWAGELEECGAQAARPLSRSKLENVADVPGERPLAPADFPAEPPETPEVYVSYAWKQDSTEPLVEELIAGLSVHGRIQVLRDSDQLQPGDSISDFMKRLSAGRCVLLVISEAYLRSYSCMTELLGIWVNSRQDVDTFRKHIVPLVQADAAIGTPQDRIAHGNYWKQQHDEVKTKIQCSPEIVGVEDFRRFKHVGHFYSHVGDILSFVDDVLVPRDRPTLSRENFAVVRGLIERAMK